MTTLAVILALVGSAGAARLRGDSRALAWASKSEPYKKCSNLGPKDCPDANLCVGVSEPPVQPPSWPDESYQYGIDTKALASTGIGFLPGGDIINSMVSIFWPHKPDAVDPRVVSMFDMQTQWTEQLVEQKIDQAEVKGMIETLNTWGTAMKQYAPYCEVLEQPAYCKTQVEQMEQLSHTIDSMFGKFSGTDSPWQGMALFPSYVAILMNVKAYLFNAYSEGNEMADASKKKIINYDVQSHVQLAKDRATDQKEAIVKTRLDAITGCDADTDEYECINGTPYMHSICGKNCYPHEWKTKDTWSGCAWDVAIKGNTCYSEAHAGYWDCYVSDCPNHGAECRQSHYDAVEKVWEEYWTAWLIDVQPAWDQFAQVMETKQNGCSTASKDRWYSKANLADWRKGLTLNECCVYFQSYVKENSGFAGTDFETTSWAYDSRLNCGSTCSESEKEAGLKNSICYMLGKPVVYEAHRNSKIKNPDNVFMGGLLLDSKGNDMTNIA